MNKKMKRCWKCKTFLPVTFFAKDNTRKDNLSPRCRKCQSKYYKLYLDANRDKILKKRNERYRIKYKEHYANYYCTNKVKTMEKERFRKYKISTSIFHSMLEYQDGRCAICGFDFSLTESAKKCDRPHIDHNHKTGNIRGLLCGKCNLALGLMEDDPDTLIAAANYIKSRIKQSHKAMI